MSHKKYDGEVADQIVQAYKSGFTTGEIAKKYNTDRRAIHRTLIRLGCPIRSVSESKKLYFTRNESPRKGVSLSHEHIKKLRGARPSMRGENNPNYGKGLRGADNPRWLGGVSAKSRIGRNTSSYKLWRKNVLERDMYTCQLCKSRNVRKLECHHIINWREDKSLQFEVGNGITLCKSCHCSIGWKETQYISLFREIVKLNTTI